MSAAEFFVSKLTQVREVPPGSWKGRWLALCPAHEDKNPSLAVTEHQDGRLLIKCWAGCGAIDIVNALGLELKDLFPPTDRNYDAFYRPRRTRATAQNDDEEILRIARGIRANGGTLSPSDMEAERKAFLRVKRGLL
jgi:hypothetical protein